VSRVATSREMQQRRSSVLKRVRPAQAAVRERRLRLLPSQATEPVLQAARDLRLRAMVAAAREHAVRK
jgi:hypothetical protein